MLRKVITDLWSSSWIKGKPLFVYTKIAPRGSNLNQSQMEASWKMKRSTDCSTTCNGPNKGLPECTLSMILCRTYSRNTWLADNLAAPHPHWNDAVKRINKFPKKPKPLKKIIRHDKSLGNGKPMYFWDSCSVQSFYCYLLYFKP